jgi:hypothetical protein
MPQTCGTCRSSITDGDAFCQTCGSPVASAYSLDVLPESPDPAIAAVPTGGLPSWATPGRTGGLPSAPVTTAVPSAAAAPSGANETYMGARLQYKVPPEPTFDPLGNGRFLAQVGLRAALYILTYWLVSTVILVIFFVADIGSIANSLSSNAGTVNQFGDTVAPVSSSPINGFGDFLLVVLALFSLAMAISFWFTKIPILLSEWKLTVDGKAAATPMVFSHIAAVLYQRGTPIAPMRVQRFRLPQTGLRDYLELHSDMFYGYVACFGYGQDLYIGWTFWSKLSPIRYVFMFIARLWQSAFNRGSDLHVMLRYDSARALREVIHSATREGVDVAVGRLDAHGQGIIGSAIPVAEYAGTR